MYNRRIHTIMAKRYTKRAYKKRRTLRKLRVKHRNTQRGGIDFKSWGNKINEFKAAGQAKYNEVAATNPEIMEKIAAGKETLNKAAAAAEAKGRELAAAAEAAAGAKFSKIKENNPGIMDTIEAGKAAGQAKYNELAAAAEAAAGAKFSKIKENNPGIMDTIEAGKAAGQAKYNELAAAVDEQTGKFKAANPNLMAGVNDISTKASEMVKDGQTMVANGVANGKAMVANGMPNAATVLTKTSLGALNAFVALAKAMYSLMDMINIAKYYTSNPTFALAQLNEKTSEIRTNLLATYPEIDTCITALQTAIVSQSPPTAPPELIPPESFIEKLTRLHNEISTDGVYKTIHRDISAINAAMTEMSNKSENPGLIECFNEMKKTVLATVELKKSLIISGITKLKNANPKTFSAGLKLVNAAKAIGAKMATAGVQAKAASVQAQAAVGQSLKQAQAAIEPAIQQASQQAAAAMSSIKSGPSQAAKAALDEVKKDAEAYAAKTETALQVAKGEVAKTTKHINDNESKLSKALGLTWQMEKNQYDMRKEFQTQIFNAASNYAYNAATLLDKANAAAAPQLSNEDRKAALIELKNAAETNVATTANLLNTATKLKAYSITAKGKGGWRDTEGTTFELNQNEIKSTNNLRAAEKQYEEAKALLGKVNIAQQLYVNKKG